MTDEQQPSAPAEPLPLMAQAAQAAETGESPMREGFLRDARLVISYVRSIRRRKGTPEEKKAERFVFQAVARAFEQWQKQQPRRAQRVKKPTKQPVSRIAKRAEKKSERKRSQENQRRRR